MNSKVITIVERVLEAQRPIAESKQVPEDPFWLARLIPKQSRAEMLVTG